MRSPLLFLVLFSLPIYSFMSTDLHYSIRKAEYLEKGTFIMVSERPAKIKEIGRHGPLVYVEATDIFTWEPVKATFDREDDVTVISIDSMDVGQEY